MPYIPSAWVDGPGGNTPITAAQLARLETQYTQAVADAGSAASTALASGVASVVQVKEAPLTPYRYGSVNPIAGSDNTAALTAMFAAAAGSTYTGSEIYLPAGLWRTTASLPLVSNLVIRGAGSRTRLAGITDNLFSWNVPVFGVSITDLWLDAAAAGKGIFVPGASGGIFRSSFRGLFLTASTDTSTIWNQTNAQSFIHNTFQDCEMQRTATSTVVPFSIINSGGAANFNQFNQVRFNGLNNVNTPFMHIESTLASTYLTDWTLINILGEQNPGGLIRILGAFNWTVINATDEDSTVDYAANLIDFQANASSLRPRNITVMGSGRRGRQMTAGTYDISVDTAGVNVAIINCDPTPVSGQTLLNLPKSASVTGVRGYPQQYQGAGSPESALTAVVGSIYFRTDGGASTSLYVKESGSGNTGWIAK
jgi:hypothetical protein